MHLSETHVISGTANMDYYEKKDYLDSEDAYINLVVLSEPLAAHAHDFIEIAFIADGTGIHTIGGQDVLITSGDIFVINYDVPHSFTPNPDSALTIYNCLFTPALFGYSMTASRDFSDITRHFLFQSLHPENLKTHWKTSSGTAYELFRKMLSEYREKGYGYMQVIRAYLIELLMLIFRANKAADEHKSFEQTQFYKALEYIDANYAKDLKLDELATLAFVSPAYFSRRFKAVTGCTFKEYLQRRRIEQACKLLKTTPHKVIDIAAEVGYHDLKHFNEIFKRIMQVTPSEFKAT